MHLFHPYLFLKIQSCCKTYALFFFCCRLPIACFLVIIINITILDEVLSEFTHTLSILWRRTVSNHTCSSSWLGELSLWKDIISSSIRWFVTRKVPTLNINLSTLLFLDCFPLISLEMKSKNWLPLPGSYLSINFSSLLI